MPDIYPQLQWDPNCFGPGYYYLQRGWDEEGEIIIWDMRDVDHYQAKGEDGTDVLSFTLIWCLNPCREKQEYEPPKSIAPFLPYPNPYLYPYTYSINYEYTSFLFYALGGNMQGNNMLYTPWNGYLNSLFTNTGLISRPYLYFQNYPYYYLNYPYYPIYPYYHNNQNYRNYSYYQNYQNYPYYQYVLPFYGRQSFLPYLKYFTTEAQR